MAYPTDGPAAQIGRPVGAESAPTRRRYLMAAVSSAILRRWSGRASGFVE